MPPATLVPTGLDEECAARFEQHLETHGGSGAQTLDKRDPLEISDHPSSDRRPRLYSSRGKGQLEALSCFKREILIVERVGGELSCPSSKHVLDLVLKS